MVIDECKFGVSVVMDDEIDVLKVDIQWRAVKQIPFLK